MRKSGFTLVEVLVVMAITAIVGAMLVVIFTNTLRGSNKAQILAVIKQNGQSVLDNIDKNIRNADNVACVTPSGNTLVIVKNGTYSRYRFFPPGTTNGYIQQDNPTPFRNALCSDDTDPLVTPVTLTDTNTQTGVSVEGGSFAKNPSAGFKDQITIQFNLKPGIGVPLAVSSQIDPVSFQTTIELR